MDSDNSRPGSSASNSSSNVSDISPASSPISNNVENKSALEDSVRSPENSTDVLTTLLRSRKRSRSSQGVSERTPSRTVSQSSSSSSSSSDIDAKSIKSDTKTKSKSSTERSSSLESVDGPEVPTSCNNLASKNSSTSSNNSPCSSRSVSKELTNKSRDITQEYLSDVSDMESDKRTSSFNNSKLSVFEEAVTGYHSTAPTGDSYDQHENIRFSVDGISNDEVVTDLRQKLDQKKNHFKAFDTNENLNKIEFDGNENSAQLMEDLVKTHDEDALDFEAEEGECQEQNKNDDLEEKQKHNNIRNSEVETEDEEELEEGEVSDEDEKRPEETEPKPVCRFYTRGQCTWGMSCRFLHPGVTDKGNYTMFDLVRAVPVPQGAIAGGRSGTGYIPHLSDYHDFRTERPPLHQRTAIQHHQVATVYQAHSDSRATITSTLLPDAPVVVESAWERGLRTAKEMMRKANKRKEQDMDFEDKKMNLTLSPDELEKDPYYLKERTTPPEVVASYGRQYQEPSSGIYSSPTRFGRALPVPVFDEVDPYGRSTRYRELPPHRMPQYEDERRVRPTREVIVQRVEPIGRADEWNDPWMRSKSPGGRGSSRDHGDKRRRDRRSYSSNSSYSSSSSSQSDSSSDSSRSPSPPDRYTNNSNKSPTARRHARIARSPSSSQRRSRRSPDIHRSPITKRRVHKSPASIAKRSYGSGYKRNKLSTPPKKIAIDNSKPKHRHTSTTSGTGSSDSSASDSESDSSSSESSSHSKQRAQNKRVRALEKVSINDQKLEKKEAPLLKKRSPISIEIKRIATVGASALSSPTNSISSEKDSKKTRREELLKQLRAVEDAIAKKRSKLT